MTEFLEVAGGRIAYEVTGDGSISAWTRYLDHAFPGPKPDGYGELISALQAHLREPGRMAATRKMGRSRPTVPRPGSVASGARPW